MPPKSSKAVQDDSKADGTTTKEKPSGSGSHHNNGKMRRVASSTGSNLREVTNANAATDTAPAKHEPQSQNPGIQWNTFDRETLHAYRREHHLNTQTSFSCSYRQLVLSRPGGIGLHSPTMARKKVDRRQSKEQLAMAVRKHFNGLGVQENDVIVDFIHKVRSHSITKADRNRRPKSAAHDT